MNKLLLFGLFGYLVLSPRISMEDWTWLPIAIGALAAVVYEWRSNERTLNYLLDHESRLSKLEASGE